MDWDAEMDGLRKSADRFFELLNRDGATCCQLSKWVDGIVHLSIDMEKPPSYCQRGTPGCDIAHEHNRHWLCDEG